MPIIPSYLYTVDDEAAQVVRNNSVSPLSPSGTFQSIVSLYDNTTRLTGFTPQMSNAGPMTPAPTFGTPPQNGSDCPKADDQLLNENVRVGLLFASKATVQLITNPFIGPLTNRCVMAKHTFNFESTANSISFKKSMRLHDICVCSECKWSVSKANIAVQFFFCRCSATSCCVITRACPVTPPHAQIWPDQFNSAPLHWTDPTRALQTPGIGQP